MLFLRVLLLQNSSMIVRFCLHCDRNAHLLSQLIRSLREIFESGTEDGMMDISITSRSLEYVVTNPMASSIEIAVYFVHSCYKAQNTALKILVSLTWADILHMFTVAASLVKGKCCYILLQGMHSLVVLTHELMLDDARGSAIGAFCNVLVTPRGPEAAEVKRIAYETVTCAIETSPAAFNGHWNEIMSALSEFKWRPSSREFCSSLTIRQVLEILQGLLAIVDGQEWALEIVNDVLSASMQRFEEVWPPIEGAFLIDDPLIVNSLAQLLREEFYAKSERFLCQTIEKRFESGLCSPVLLEALRQLLSQNGTVFNEGWPFILRALNPQFVSGEISDAFRCVQIAANDLMFHLSGETQSMIIQLIFQFAGQLTDINISLSSFGLLWNVVPICSTLTMWTIVLTGAAKLIQSPRSDVTLCAVSTFFSLIVSNAQALPTEIFPYIAKELFLPMVDFLAGAAEEAQQRAFHELAHCGRNLWDQFKSDESFSSELWPKLIAGHERFMTICLKREILIAGFQFYEEAFQCTELSSDLSRELYDSIQRITTVLVKRENVKSPLYGALGRMIRIVLPLQKPRLNRDVLKRWIDLIEYTIFELETGGLLPPTSHKAMDAMVLLFPLPIDLAVLVYQSLVKMACNNLNIGRLTDIALEHLTEVCHTVGDDLLPTFFVLSKHLFKLKGARKLLLEFVQKDTPMPDEIVEEVGTPLLALGQSDVELRESAATSLLKLYPRLSDQTKLAFLTVYKESISALTTLLQRFCDPKSAEFAPNIAQLCAAQAVERLGALLVNEGSDQVVVTVLKFLLRFTTPNGIFQDCSEANEHFHLFVMLPCFAELVLRENEGVRKKLRKILLVVASKK
jgi:hypothetical protein